MVGLSEGGKVTLVVVVVVTVKFEAEAAKKLRGDVTGFEISTVEVFTGKLEKAGEVEAVIVDGAAGAATFDFKGFEKIIDEFRDVHNLIIAELPQEHIRLLVVVDMSKRGGYIPASAIIRL